MGRKIWRENRRTFGAITLLNRLLLYWHTVRHLRATQIFWRIWYSGYRPRVRRGNIPTMRPRSRHWRSCREYKNLSLTADKAVFLNIEADIARTTIWNDADYPKLWLYNLHYFDYLRERQSPERAGWDENLILRWIRENPVGLGVGWEPYPTSRRIVSWIKWLFSRDNVSEDICESVVYQVRHLSKTLEFHILGNHLLANAKALCFAGLFFNGQEATDWLSRGSLLLEQQVSEQILLDGGHFERSPMYHLIILEDLLDLIQLMSLYEKQTPSYLQDAVRRMLKWSQVMRHPDGEIPFFNDSAFGVAANPIELDRYANALGFATYNLELRPTHLADSGYIKLASHNAVLLANIGGIAPNFLPGHAHADTLSFEFSLMCRRVIVNSGTSVYGIGAERQRQRSTSAHSTLNIDNKNSSEVWSGFRVARRARVTRACFNRGTNSAEAEHNGYDRLEGSPRHRRKWCLSKGMLSVLDTVSGQGTHEIELNFYFGPALVPNINRSGIVHILNEDGDLILQIITSEKRTLSVDETTWHPRFGEEVKAWRLTIKKNLELPYFHRSIFSWGKKK